MITRVGKQRQQATKRGSASNDNTTLSIPSGTAMYVNIVSEL